MVLNIKTFYTSWIKVSSSINTSNLGLFLREGWCSPPRIHVSAYPLQYTLGLFLGEGCSSQPRIHVSAYPLQYTLGSFLGEGWSSPPRIRVSAYPLPYPLGLYLGEGWCSPLRIHVSAVFKEAALKWQGILQLLQPRNAFFVSTSLLLLSSIKLFCCSHVLSQTDSRWQLLRDFSDFCNKLFWN